MKWFHVFPQKYEDCWTFHVFLKKSEAKGNFPDKPSHNLLKVFNLLAYFCFTTSTTEPDYHHQKVLVRAFVRFFFKKPHIFKIFTDS